MTAENGREALRSGLIDFRAGAERFITIVEHI